MSQNLRVASSEGVGGGCCHRIQFNYVNWQRKKLISKLINFILVFNLLLTQLPPKRMESHFPRAPHWSNLFPYTPLVVPVCVWLVVVSINCLTAT
jgi:hypothetical protein